MMYDKLYRLWRGNIFCHGCAFSTISLLYWVKFLSTLHLSIGHQQFFRSFPQATDNPRPPQYLLYIPFTQNTLTHTDPDWNPSPEVSHTHAPEVIWHHYFARISILHSPVIPPEDLKCRGEKGEDDPGMHRPVGSDDQDFMDSLDLVDYIQNTRINMCTCSLYCLPCIYKVWLNWP